MWVEGRQGTGYFKRTLATGKFWDAYLLKYPVGSYIPPHRDPVSGKAHRRLNVVLKHAKRGGGFWRDGGEAQRKRFTLFRPDLDEHGVDFVEEGTRWVLSIGWITQE